MTISPITREQRLKQIDGRSFDVAIIGGGAHGAFLAREAASAGLEVILLDAQDFAAGTSSRSSKMLHGGVRYLEQGEFALVFEALRERAMLRHIAPHLTSVAPFLFPILSGRTRPAYQIRLGLFLYDLLSSFPQRGLPRERLREFTSHREVTPLDPDFIALSQYGLQSERIFRYTDGQMDDARIVIEGIRDATLLGARCLNYTPVRELKRESGGFSLLFDSRFPEATGCRVRARAVVNAAGPWVNDALNGTSQTIPLRFSQGSHLLFRRSWNHPGVILPTHIPGRYYFVWPYHSGPEAYTLVGTTETELAGPSAAPQLLEEERLELLGYLKRDLPNSELNEGNLAGHFSGIRVLPSGSQTRASDLSRATRILSEQGLFSIVGGKFTTARLEAERVNRLVCRFLGNPNPPGTRLRPLPGGIGGEAGVEQARLVLSKKLSEGKGADGNIASHYAGLATRRFGSEASLLCGQDFSDTIRPGFAVLPGEIRLTISLEDPITLQDIFRRRFGFIVMPHHDDPMVRFAAEELSRFTGRTERELLAEFRA